jgi:hypothetical protein
MNGSGGAIKYAQADGVTNVGGKFAADKTKTAPSKGKKAWRKTGPIFQAGRIFSRPIGV